MPKVVTAAIVVRNGRVLLTRRASGQAQEGYWEFPGGKLETGESERACLERELFEELGIEGVAGEHLVDSLHRYASGEILLKAYLFRWTKGEICLTVHDKVTWVHPEDLEVYTLAPADLPIARAVAARFGNTSSEERSP